MCSLFYLPDGDRFDRCTFVGLVHCKDIRCGRTEKPVMRPYDRRKETGRGISVWGESSFPESSGTSFPIFTDIPDDLPTSKLSSSSEITTLKSETTVRSLLL